MDGDVETYEEMLEQTPNLIKALADEIVQDLNDETFEEGVSVCQAVLKQWLMEIREQIKLTATDAAGQQGRVDQSGHYCQFRERPIDKQRSHWRWRTGEGWLPVSPAEIILSNMGSQYMVASTGDGSLTEFHICGDPDCSDLASSLKSTLTRCIDDAKTVKVDWTDSQGWSHTPAGGLEPASEDSESAGFEICRKCQVREETIVDGKEKRGSGRMVFVWEKTRKTGDNGRLDERVYEAIKTKYHPMDHGQSQDSQASGCGGFLSHYAYERTCDVIQSMTSSKKLLASVVDDETEQMRSQYAGRVQNLIQMFNWMRRG